MQQEPPEQRFSIRAALTLELEGWLTGFTFAGDEGARC